MEKLVPKPRLNAQERRASIMEAALKLFSERGFRGTTTREIAAAVGVSEPVLYEHFRTKADLYTAIIDARSQDGLERLQAFREYYLERDDDRGFFTALAGMVLDWFTADPAYPRLLLYSGLERHELKEQFYQRQSRAYFEIVVDYVRRRVDQGVFRGSDPDLMTKAFVGMVAHYAQSLVLFECDGMQRGRREVLDTMVDLFLNGIRQDTGNNR